MTFLTITCSITALPALFPLYRMIRKKELNMFDFLILFSTLHFCISPIKEGKLVHFSDLGIMREFIFYALYIFSILFVDIICHRRYERSTSIVNLTQYLQRFSKIEIDIYGRVLIGLCLFIMLTYYLPHASIVAAVENTNISYEESSLTMALGNVIKVVGSFLFLDFSYNLKRKETNKINVFFLCLYILILLFFPRREFLSGLLQLLLTMYSINRSFFTLKKVVIMGCFASFLWVVYFPFYNVVRWNPVRFDSSHPVESLTQIVEYGINNYSQNSTEQLESSEQRSLGLYQAVYMLANRNISLGYGEISLASVDIAIPKVLNPNKGNGSEPILENMTGAHVDIADSLMLLSYGDFGIVGGFYCCFLYAFVILLYNRYAMFFKKKLSSASVPVFILFTMFDYLWNVEGKLESYLSWFFGSIFTILIILFLEKKNVIRILKKSNIYIQ